MSNIRGMHLHNTYKKFVLYNILWYYVSMEYKLQKSNRKTISIQILQNGEVLVKAPLRASHKLINEFVLSKQNWIISKSQNIQREKEQHIDFINLEKIVIFGEELKILDDGKKIVFGSNQIKHNKNTNKCSIIKNYIKNLAENYIKNRTKELAESLNLCYKNIKIISAKKKWGSCNSKNELKFNYKLVMLPKHLIDYVICHELCHLVELNHSDRFWNLMQKLGFNKKIIRQQMKPYSFVLNMF